MEGRSGGGDVRVGCGCGCGDGGVGGVVGAVGAVALLALVEEFPRVDGRRLREEDEGAAGRR